VVKNHQYYSDPQQGTPVSPLRAREVETHSGRKKAHVMILNNHWNLMYFQTSQNLNHRQAHLSLFLSMFNFSLITDQGGTPPNQTLSLIRWTTKSKRKITKIR